LFSTLQSGGGVLQRAAVAHFGHNLQSSSGEHSLSAVHFPIVCAGHGFAQIIFPSGCWQLKRLRVEQFGISSGRIVQRDADVQTGSHILQSSVGSHVFFSLQISMIGGMQIFCVISHTSGVLQSRSCSHVGWHFPSKLHFEPLGHSPFGPHEIRVHRDVQKFPEVPFPVPLSHSSSRERSIVLLPHNAPHEFVPGTHGHPSGHFPEAGQIIISSPQEFVPGVQGLPSGHTPDAGQKVVAGTHIFSLH